MPNFSWEILGGKKEKKNHTTLHIFSRLLTRQDGLQNRDSILRPPSSGIFLVFHHSVPSFRQSAIAPNSVTLDILMSKKILNGRLISVLLRIESVGYVLYRQMLVFWKKKIIIILGRNELSFRDQDVPRSRERQCSNILFFFPLRQTLDIDMNDSRPKKHWVRFLSIDRWPEASTRDPTTIRSR